MTSGIKQYPPTTIKNKSQSTLKIIPQMKKTSSTKRGASNRENYKRTRDPMSPPKNYQNKNIKEHTSQIPVLGTTGTGYQDPPRGRTNLCGQQPERDPRALSRVRRNQKNSRLSPSKHRAQPRER